MIKTGLYFNNIEDSEKTISPSLARTNALCWFCICLAVTLGHEKWKFDFYNGGQIKYFSFFKLCQWNFSLIWKKTILLSRVWDGVKLSKSPLQYIEPKKLDPKIYFYISDTVQSSLVICICVFVCTLIWMFKTRFKRKLLQELS